MEERAAERREKSRRAGEGGGGRDAGRRRAGRQKKRAGATWRAGLVGPRLSRDMFALELASAPVNSSSSFSERFGAGGDDAASGGGVGGVEHGLPPPEFRSKYSVSFAADYPPVPQPTLRRLSDPLRTRIWGPPIRGSAGKGPFSWRRSLRASDCSDGFRRPLCVRSLTLLSLVLSLSHSLTLTHSVPALCAAESLLNHSDCPLPGGAS